ncbi:hypothetical protein vseg_007704 [Gypsophila vaccaria]
MALVQEVRNATSSDKQHATVVTLCNQTMATMKLDRVFIWSGHPGGPGIPATLLPGSAASFAGNTGSMGAVVYDGLNAANQPCSWVLAWDAPSDETVTPKKVYVICGYSSVIDKLSFDEIRRSLERSGPISTYTDTASRTSASAAAIQNHGLVNVGSEFGLAIA